ncbi:hypothetical protein MOE20_19505 [Bacillus atrophaeus]|uniref:hypothetical protein n=1 Tax=Bacillus atrophaeus TaxID=1452 RepID=UPI002282DE4C|nr:hypothetical protein [Bacillus atrophaeus]MCY8918566.1 hypothetical protein [Bacillus atrophaeus]MCY8926746.1 hypothetical protein [Bacillus atrophaeus]
MNRINFKRLLITINTKNGMFGADLSFKQGLNILRDKNSRGKTSVLNSILYALGIEELLGGKNSKTMKPALKNKLIYNEEEIEVLQSKVELEISNNKEEIITLTRWIKDPKIDERLVRVYFGPSISENEKYGYKDYYLHMKGSAYKSSGFHFFLQKFLEWDLPLVPTFKEKHNLLYIQSLFPLFFVEQTKGWGDYYTPISGNFGIRDLFKRAFEFVLNMDVTKNAKEKEELKILRQVLLNRWKTIKKNLYDLALRVNAEIPDLPEEPNTSKGISLNIYNEGEFISLENKIFQIEYLIKEKENFNDIALISKKAPKHEQEIKEKEFLVLNLQNELNSMRKDLVLEKNNRKTMEENLKTLELDLVRNQEAEKLLKLGSSFTESFSYEVCPTCNQHVEDMLLFTENQFQPLHISDNVKFIKEQIKTVKFGIKESEKIIKNKELKLNSITDHLNKARRELRLYKAELSENPKLPSKVDLEKLVELKLLMSKLREAADSLEKINETCILLKKDWVDYKARVGKLPAEYFSDLDEKKLNHFEIVFLKLLKDFGYASSSVDDITISKDRYTPTAAGYDIKFDPSASDNIRVKWAYILAIYDVSLEYSGNHLGVITLDEPGQHSMDKNSQEKLFSVLSKMDGQFIIGTSVDNIKELTKGLDVNVLDYGEEYIIRPLNL